MNKKILLSNFVFFLTCFMVFGQTPDQHMEKCIKIYDEGVELYNRGVFQKALVQFEEAYGIARKNFPETEQMLELVVLRIAWCHEALKQYEQAFKWYEEDIRLVQISSPPYETNTMAYRLTNYASLLIDSGQNKQAISLLKKALDQLNLLRARGLLKVKKNEEPILGIVLHNLGVAHYEQFLFQEARNYLIEALKIKKEYLGVNHQSYKSTEFVFNLAKDKNEIGDFMGKSIVDLIPANEKNLSSKELLIFGKQFLENEEFEKAEDYYSRALEITAKEKGQSHFEYGTILNNMSILYRRMGEINNSIQFAEKAIENLIVNFGKKSSNYPIWANNLATIYLDNKNFDKAGNYYIEAVKYANLNLEKNNLYYNRILNNSALFLKRTGNFKEAENHLNEAIRNVKKYFGEKHPDYGNLLNTMAGLYADKNDLVSAEKFYKNSLENRRSNLGENHSEYAETLINLATIYLLMGKTDKVFDLMVESNQIQLREIKHMLRFRSEQENKAYLVPIRDLFQMNQSFDIITNQRYPESIAMNLNNVLILKGLLLDNSVNVIDGLKKLNEPSLELLIAEYQRNRKRLIELQLALKKNDETNLYADKVNDIEEHLIKLYNEKYPDNGAFYKSWVDVKNTLGPKEIAIEFSSFRYRNTKQWTDSIIYVAYLIKREWDNPKMISLFEEKDLVQLTSKKTPSILFGRGGVSVSKSENNIEKLYDLVWKPLEPYTESTTKVFYSPDGLLHQYPLGILGKKIQEKESIRLTSIYNVSKGINEPSIESALLVGGVNYDSQNIESTPTLNNKENKQKWNFLPGTLDEVQKIKSYLEKKNIDVSLLKGLDAHEQFFYSMNGQSPKILHLATHGFFYKNENSANERNSVFISSENPLVRSGLVLSGGNSGWLYESQVKSKDGILTALEIANMDLSNTDLVVLSACETGLGEIDSDEGVYGLQRAFKLAGVDLIIMSLWQVPDKETSEFMDLFYSYWIGEGLNIRKAFTESQFRMSELYPGQADKWAGFILVQ